MAVHKGLAQVVAELRDLPPAGKWANHPCCCVAATEKTIRIHGKQVKAVLKLLLLSTQLIHDDQALAIDCAVRWTKNPHAVESQSVPTVTYLGQPTEGWIAGMKTWLEMVKAVDFFKGKYAQITADDFVRDLCALDLCRAAAQELQQNGRLRTP
jgi:NitT/TauT family transport system substrate-binding protein